jgi:hypothetical protein
MLGQHLRDRLRRGLIAPRSGKLCLSLAQGFVLARLSTRRSLAISTFDLDQRRHHLAAPLPQALEAA